MGSLRSSITRDERGRTHLKLSGAIDESSDLPGMFKELGADVEIDLEGVERINSIGVHRWIPAFEGFCRGRAVELTGLSYPMVLQANMVANLFGNVPISSCLAPYFCTKCQDNRMSLVQRTEVSSSGLPPARKCPVCGEAMSFDELENYFSFFLHQPKSAAGGG
jgi:hypothetical protein